MMIYNTIMHISRPDQKKERKIKVHIDAIHKSQPFLYTLTSLISISLN